MNSDISISTNKNLLDIKLIFDFLNNSSYWAKGRSLKTVERSIENSLCFGAYNGDQKQVGFARVVTDYAVFAWILDVFIIDAYRGRGLGVLLMKSITAYPDLQGLQKWGLGTRDAHGLYQKFGFKSLANPEMWMEIVNKPG